MIGLMPPIFSTRAQTQHPCGQLELQVERDRDGCVARFLLIYCDYNMQSERVNSHRNMDPRLDRGLRWLMRLLYLIRREGSRYGLLSLGRDTQGPLPLHLRAFVRYEKHLY